MRLLKKLCVPHDNSILSDGPPGSEKSVDAVGTTDYVRGGLCRMRIIKQIKASYDRFGLDVQDDAQEVRESLKSTPETRGAEFGKVIIYNFGNGFVRWSPNLCLDYTDFLMTPRSVTVASAIAADLNERQD